MSQDKNSELLDRFLNGATSDTIASTIKIAAMAACKELKVKGKSPQYSVINLDVH